MTSTRLTTVGAVLAATIAYLGPAAAEIVATRELEESLTVTAGEPLVVIVKNVIGPIRVTGHDSSSVEMHATETVHADLQADIARARAEMQLVTEQEPGRIAFRVRSNGEDDDCNCDWGRWNDYRVEYDIELRLPRNAAIELTTVNDGDVIAEGMRGNFTLRNVNGAVQVVDAGGSGSITTVNGDVHAAFAQAPAGPTAFKTVNGSLDVTFPERLAAELTFTTMNGDVFTDFDVESLREPPLVETSRTRGAFVLRSNRNSAFRVGGGGTRHTFNTLNGNIYVRKAKP
ncbi:MAG TPA: DUF4097 family beta strand repeat-containing protein [Gammaproteobacteria bacterium]|nr:DUF4097 family beta strand repeat-containing protein [Gammaproteobacteria bacterium]